MSKKGICYDGSTPRGLHLRAVVTSSGDVVPKNYDSRQLIDGSQEGQPGDVGITVRVDGRTDCLTPAQQASLQHVAGLMSGKLLERVGVDTDYGFKPGTVVLFSRGDHEDDKAGYVERQADGGLYLRYFTAPHWRLTRVFIPMNACQVEEVPDLMGLDGLFWYCASQEYGIYGFGMVDAILKHCTPSAEVMRRVLTEVEHKDKSPVTVMALLTKIGDQELINRLALDGSSCDSWAATRLVTDQVTLVSLLGQYGEKVRKHYNEETEEIGRSILCRIDDSHVFEAACRLMEQDTDFPQLLGDVLNRITEPAQILELAKRATSNWIPEEDIYYLLDRLDQAGLKAVYLANDPCREFVLERMKPATIIELADELVQDAKTKGALSDEWALRHLVDKIDDQVWLARFCLEWNPDWQEDCYWEALRKLTDLEAALQALEARPDWTSQVLTRPGLKQGLTHEEALLQVIYNHRAQTSLVKAIFRRSTDIGWLEKLSDSNPEVMGCLVQRIQALRAQKA